MRLGPIGIWTFQFDRHPVGACLEAAAEIENLGFPSIWVPEQSGHEAMSLASLLLSATDRIIIANGIARASARDARSMQAAHMTLSEAFPGRYILGIGGQTRLPGENPVRAMDMYLEAMDNIDYRPGAPTTSTRRVLAAINPEMLRLANRKCWGAHTYLCPPAQTERARNILDRDHMLITEQPVALESDPERARIVARRHLAFYLRLAPYRAMLKQLGFRDNEFEDGGSNSVVDTLVAWGDEAAIVERVKRQLEAGADHVCLQVLPEDEAGMPIAQWQRLSQIQGEFNRSAHLDNNAGTAGAGEADKRQHEGP